MQHLLFLIFCELSGKKNGWDINELKYLTLAMDTLPEELNFFTLSDCLFRRNKKNVILSVMSDYQLFLAFEKGECINLNDMPKINSYICGHLISWSPNWSYFECQCNSINELFIFCDWKQNCGLPIFSKKGEAICEGKLVIFFEDEQHKKRTCSIVWNLSGKWLQLFLT